MRKLLPVLLAFCPLLVAQTSPPATPSIEKPRVFVTDSQSWETRGGGGGTAGSWGGSNTGGARPQTAEIIKTFGERCPQVVVNNKAEKADYIVTLDHEGGKSVFAHKNKVAVFDAVSGDSIVSHSTLSLGGSVQDACEAITKHWAQHGADMRAARNTPPPSPKNETVAPPPELQKHRITVASLPDNADIEVDGSFVGNTPSGVDLTPGQHKIVVKKNGYTPWERTINISGGDVHVTAELEKN